MVFLTKQIIITLTALPDSESCVQIFEPSRKRIVLKEHMVSLRSRP